MIRENKSMRGSSCSSCDSDEEVSEYLIGSVNSSIGIKLCERCKIDFVQILQKKEIQELKDLLDQLQ